jgi:MoaA/NifB/PqqE/SkfB family radical SAM enzyme
VLDKAWKVGIPHVVFTGGEPTLREDLPQLIAHAESLGQVSGILTDGLRLVDEAYLQTLLQTGLDHVMITFQPDNPVAWKALQNVRAADIFDAVHLTVTPQNAADMPELLKKLAEQQVQALSLSASAPDLAKKLPALYQQADGLQMQMIADLPVPYSSMNPFASEEQDAKLPEGAGRAWLYVEPDGDVLPSQGVNRLLGNMLRDPWEKIWMAA